MKPSAADKRLLRHRGKVIAFEDYNHMAREIERDDLDVTPDHILVLKNGGPKGGPGMPEWGMLPIPKKLVKQGVRDMLRISDARMSGTSYGACILHVAPESFVGRPACLRQNRRRNRGGRSGTTHPPPCIGRGNCPPPRDLETTRIALPARLRCALFATHRASGRRLRFRFSRAAWCDPRARNPLKRVQLPGCELGRNSDRPTPTFEDQA